MLAVATGGEHGRRIGKEKAMLATGKLVLSAAIAFSIAFALATSAAFANAPDVGACPTTLITMSQAVYVCESPAEVKRSLRP
jgi:hypothetical protein